MAGLAAWGGGEACLDLFKPPRHAVNSKGLVLKVTDRREVAVTDAKNAGLAFALLGAALGAAMGVAGGLVRRSVRAGTRAAALGLVAGTAAGAGMSLALLPLYNAYMARNPDEAVRDLILPCLFMPASGRRSVRRRALRTESAWAIGDWLCRSFLAGWPARPWAHWRTS